MAAANPECGCHVGNQESNLTQLQNALASAGAGNAFDAFLNSFAPHRRSAVNGSATNGSANGASRGVGGGGQKVTQRSAFQLTRELEDWVRDWVQRVLGRDLPRTDNSLPKSDNLKLRLYNVFSALIEANPRKLAEVLLELPQGETRTPKELLRLLQEWFICLLNKGLERLAEYSNPVHGALQKFIGALRDAKYTELANQAADLELATCVALETDFDRWIQPVNGATRAVKAAYRKMQRIFTGCAGPDTPYASDDELSDAELGEDARDAPHEAEETADNAAIANAIKLVNTLSRSVPQDTRDALQGVCAGMATVERLQPLGSILSTSWFQLFWIPELRDAILKKSDLRTAALQAFNESQSFEPEAQALREFQQQMYEALKRATLPCATNAV